MVYLELLVQEERVGKTAVFHSNVGDYEIVNPITQGCDLIYKIANGEAYIF